MLRAPALFLGFDLPAPCPVLQPRPPLSPSSLHHQSPQASPLYMRQLAGAELLFIPVSRGAGLGAAEGCASCEAPLGCCRLDLAASVSLVPGEERGFCSTADAVAALGLGDWDFRDLTHLGTGRSLFPKH